MRLCARGVSGQCEHLFVAIESTQDSLPPSQSAICSFTHAASGCQFGSIIFSMTSCGISSCRISSCGISSCQMFSAGCPSPVRDAFCWRKGSTRNAVAAARLASRALVAVLMVETVSVASNYDTANNLRPVSRAWDGLLALDFWTGPACAIAHPLKNQEISKIETHQDVKRGGGVTWIHHPSTRRLTSILLKN